MTLTHKHASLKNITMWHLLVLTWKNVNRVSFFRSLLQILFKLKKLIFVFLLTRTMFPRFDIDFDSIWIKQYVLQRCLNHTPVGKSIMSHFSYIVWLILSFVSPVFCFNYWNACLFDFLSYVHKIAFISRSAHIHSLLIYLDVLKSSNSLQQKHIC